MKGRERSSTPGESLPHLDPPAHWELSQAPHDFHLRPLEEGEGLGSPTLSFIFNKVPLKKEEKKKEEKKKKKEKKKKEEKFFPNFPWSWVRIQIRIGSVNRIYIQKMFEIFVVLRVSNFSS